MNIPNSTSEAGVANTRGSAASQLRDDIDRGRSGEKVNWPDPAAAPLGTDDEAAGTPSPTAAINATRHRERARPAESLARWRPHAFWVQVAIVVLLVAAVIGWIASRL
jgi:hypothetical protein